MASKKSGKGGATVDDMLKRSLGRHVAANDAKPSSETSVAAAPEAIDEENLPLWKKIANQRPTPQPMAKVVEGTTAQVEKPGIRRAGAESTKRISRPRTAKPIAGGVAPIHSVDVNSSTPDDFGDALAQSPQLPTERLNLVKALASLHNRLGSERFAKYMILRELQGPDESLRLSQREIQNLIGFSRQGVRKFLGCLKDDGCLAVVTPADPETSQPTVYRVLPPIEAVDSGQLVNPRQP